MTPKQDQVRHRVHEQDPEDAQRIRQVAESHCR